MLCAVACGPTGVPGAACALSGRAAWCARGRRSSCLLFVAPTDLRPPRGLPARSPSALRASLGASARSPARPRRPRGGLRSVGVSVCCPAIPRRRPPAPRPGPPVPPAPSTPVGPGRCVCWWVAARPRAVRAASFARRVVSKPGQAPAQRHRSVTRCPQASCPALACRIAEPTTNIACNSLGRVSWFEV